MREAIGIDHVYLTVSDLGASERFYDKVLVGTLAFSKNTFALVGETHLHYFNRHFGLVLRPARSMARHEPYAPGLHHLCLRVDSAEDVRAVAARLQSQGIDASDAELHPQYAPDYVATFFRDPDGIRLEITNYRHERVASDMIDGFSRPSLMGDWQRRHLSLLASICSVSRLLDLRQRQGRDGGSGRPRRGTTNSTANE